MPGGVTLQKVKCHDTTTQQPLARYHLTNDRRTIAGTLRLGGPGRAHQHPVLQRKPQRQIEPDFFAQNALGEKTSGRFVCADLPVGTKRRAIRFVRVFDRLYNIQ